MDAPKALQDLLALAKHIYVSPGDLSVVHLGLGDTDAVFLLLEKAYQSRDAAAHMLMLPQYDGLRSDPRYADLSKRVGLPLW